MAALGAIASIAGTLVSGVGTLAAASQQSAAYEYEAKVRDQQAKEATAAGQRAAADRYRQGRIMQSRQRAVAAASSGDTTEQSVINIMGNTAKETNLGARTEMYRAEQQAKGYRDAANVARTNASNAMTSGVFGALGAGISGLSSMASRFGGSSSGTSSGRPLYG